MGSDALFLGFDVGTQGTKGVVIDAGSRRVLARAAESYGLIEGLPAGASEQHPETWVDAVRSVARRLTTADGVDPERIAGVGVSGQQHGLVTLDAHHEVVRPAKLWCDTATAAEAAELAELWGAAVPTGFTASKILWMQRHEPENWQRVSSVLLPHDYINMMLTGACHTDAGDASGTALFDVAGRSWDLDRVRTLELEGLLPDVIPAGSATGPLDARGAELLGVPEGAMVSTGGGDNMMSAIGSGATVEGLVVVSLGTSGTVFCHSSRPVIDPEGLIAPFCDSTGGWMPLLCVMNLTGVAEEVRAAFDGADHESLSESAASIAPGNDGLMLVPYLVGERVPDLPHATGSLLGIRPGLLDRGHLYRAALEGTSASLALGVERMRALGISVDRVRAVGGAARNPLWLEVLAGMIEVPVECCLEAESGALGAAIQAAWTARRASGESELTAHEAADGFVAVSNDIVEPVAGDLDTYRGVKAALADATSRLYEGEKA